MGQNIVSNSHQGIFLNKELAVLHDDGQTVHIGIHDKAHIGLALTHEVADGGEVFRDRLWCMAEVTRGVTEEFLHLLHAQGLQQLGYGDTTHRVDCINSDGEVGFADRFNVHEVKCQHLINVTTEPGIVLLLASQVVHVGIVKVLGLSETEYFLALGIGEEFAIVVEKLEGIPLLGVVRSRDDDAATSVLTHYRQFGGRSGGKADVDHIKAHAHECADHGV